MHVDWEKVFVNGLQLPNAVETIVRTVVMFLFVLLLLRLSGKRGVRQLSFFEVAIIISFGSAAGDAMFIEDLAIITSLIVLVSIVIMYRLITWMAMRSEKIESIFEGDPIYVIEDGMFTIHQKDKHDFAKDEFLSEMRQQNVEHLGQVRVAILETNGMISFIFYDDDNVRYGMPVLPKPYSQMSEQILSAAMYACAFCGNVEQLEHAKQCDRCSHKCWIKAINTKRIS